MNWTQIALIYSFSLFWSLILELPSGALADMIGRKKTVILGRLANFAGYVIAFYAQSFELFLISNILYQTNWALESGALSALLFDSLKENGKEKENYKKTETDTFFYCTVGMAIASVLGGFLFKYDIHWPYLAAAVVSGVSFVASFWYQEPLIDTEKFTLKNYIKQNVKGVKHIFENKLIRAVSVFSILTDFVSYTALWYLYEPRLAEGGFDARLMGILVSGTYLIRALGTKLIPILDKVVKPAKVPMFLAVTQIFGSAMSFFEGRAAAVGSVYSRKFVDGFRKPILATIQNENIQSKYRATSLSALSLLGNLLISAVGPVVGFSNERYGVGFTLGIFAVFGVIAVVPAAVNLGREIKIAKG